LTEAIVFDCDGVLANSEDLAWEAWRRALRGHGIEITEGDIRELTGKSQPEAYATFAARAPLPPYPDLLETIFEVLFPLFDRHLEAFPDAVTTVRELRNDGARLAVASSSLRIRLDRTLAAIGLHDAFEVSVAGNEVARGKPAPDLFQRAADELGVAPTACVAVEDSPVGVTSAKGAGMRVIAVLRTQYEESELHEADAIVDRLSVEAIRSAC
jgi:HAD superfamily hydrolase (TIGR01509 family)